MTWRAQRLASVLMAVLSIAPACAADWPGWRGPTGMGQSPEKGLPLTWSDREHLLWKQPLPGQGEKTQQDHNQSSPIVQGGRVFITVSYWPAGVDRREYPEHHVACYRLDDGTRLWDQTIKPGPWKLTDLRGGYTASTPAADAERVYVLFGSSVLAALDHAGKLVWRHEIVPYRFDVAVGCSPVLFEDTVLLQCDQVEGNSRLLALDRKTGDLKWEKKRPTMNFTHSTPVLATIQGKPQLLVAGSNALQGLNPSTGEVLWSCQASGDTVSPVYAEGLVYLDSGRGGPSLAVDPTGTGDVTRTHVKWRKKQVPEGFSSPVAVGGYLFRLHNPEMLHCWKLEDGAEIFAERLPGITTACSPLATADGRLYLASAGKSYVLQAGPNLNILATNDLGDGCSASPAVADGRLILKGQHFLYCIGQK